MKKIFDFSTVGQSIKAWIISVHKVQAPGNIIVLILLLGLIQSIIFAVVIPPWWHYDEPGHFEYAWLVANLPAWPKVGQYNQAMRQEMADSLTKYGWYKARLNNPNLSGSGPVPIGVSEIGSEPAYYLLASLPLRSMHNTDIILQYFAARLVSIILYLLIILTTWYALGEIVPEDHALRWMVPAFLALLPAFVDVMTAINSDVVATLAASLFLWASLKLINKGLSIGRLLFLGGTLVFCYLGKNTAWFTFLLAPFVLIFSLLRGRFTWHVIIISVIGVLIVAFATIEGGAPLGWYQSPPQSSPLKIAYANSPQGKYVFQIERSGTQAYGRLTQSLTPDVVKSLRGQTITLGVWLWANQAIQITPPYITFSSRANGTLLTNLKTSPKAPLKLGLTPTFYRIIIHVPEDAVFASLFVQYSLPTPDNKVFMDGLFLATGEHGNTPPHFTDPNGTLGTWDGHTYENLIRNGSAEQNSLRFQPWAEAWFNNLPSSLINAPFVMETFLNWQGISWYYRGTLTTLFTTFWISLAANKILVPTSSNYFLILLTLFGIIGAGKIIWAKRKSVHLDILFFLGLSLLLPWFLAIIRGVSDVIVEFPVFGWARYSDPGILPTALILCAGWLECLNIIKARGKFVSIKASTIFLGGMLGISALALFDGIQIFHPDWWGKWVSLVFLLTVQAIAIQLIGHGKPRFIPETPDGTYKV
jgi:hypothetical protein